MMPASQAATRSPPKRGTTATTKPATISTPPAMYIVGGVEIVAGFVVAVVPRFGGLLVAAWLAGIIVSLLLVGGYADIALRDFGLLVGAVALSRLASADLGAPRGEGYSG